MPDGIAGVIKGGIGACIRRITVAQVRQDRAGEDRCDQGAAEAAKTLADGRCGLHGLTTLRAAFLRQPQPDAARYADNRAG